MGFWWKRDLLATRCVDENIKKARRAFFSFGSIGPGVFQGSHNSLSLVSVIETCVMPVLLYKRVLQWPGHHSNTAVCIAETFSQ